MKNRNVKGGLFRGTQAQPRLLDVRSGCELNKEVDEQIAFFEWARWSANLMRHTHVREALALEWMHAIPNGLWLPGDKQLSARILDKAKRAGLTPGVFDVFLPYATDLHPGLYLEMKVGRNKLTPEQTEFHHAAFLLRYKTEVAYSWQQAAQIVIDYLELKQRQARFVPLPDFRPEISPRP